MRTLSNLQTYFRRASRSIAAVCATLLLAAPLLAARAASVGGEAHSPWVATWGAAMVATDSGSAPDFSGKTLREIVHTSVAGKQVRVWLSNRFGKTPLHVGAAHIALSAAASVGVNEGDTPNVSGIEAGTDRTLTFHDLASVVIPPGAAIVSDPVTLDVPALSNIAVSIYFPDRTMGTTEHSYADQISYAATGDETGAANQANNSWPIHSWYVLSGVDVDAPGDSAVVAFGDSITDGAHSSVNANHRWPDFLAVRLADNPATRKAGVLGMANVGIGGNRVLLDGYGPSALKRIDWDVLARSHARYLIVLESINDIARFSGDHQPYADLRQRLEWAFAQIAAQAHQHGMLIFGATLTPYGNCKCATSEGKDVRRQLNRWIRTAPDFDGVVDFARATRDPAHPEQYLPKYDSGDHVHPNDAGYQAMANAVDLTLFTKTR